MTQAGTPEWGDNELPGMWSGSDLVGGETEEEEEHLIKPPKWPSIGHSDDLTL